MNIAIETTIPDERISGLLCCAFEGGSNYWYMIEDYEFPEGVSRSDFQEGGRFTNPECYWHPSQIIPLHAGCTVIIGDTVQEGNHRLDRKAVEKGLQVMASSHPRHYADFVAENDDAETGDVFLQCCIFGDVIYG